MFISKLAWTAERDARIKAEALVGFLQSDRVALHTTMDWMRVRLNQVEQERADLIERYLGVKISVPNIAPAEKPTDNADLFNQTPSFEDVGDAEAERLSIRWDNQTGEVLYK
jgi:hypothetical protein